jgi:hypothetical protein
MGPTPEYIEHLRAMLADVIEQSTQDARQIDFDKRDAQERTVACLYWTIITASGECLVLLGRPSISVPVISRGIAESWADLLAVIANKTYVDRMFASYHYEAVRYYDDMIARSTDPHSVMMAEHFDPKVERAKSIAALKDLKKRKIERLTNKQRFKAADLEDYYGSIYWELCMRSHNNIQVLDYRHILWKDGDFEIVPCIPNSNIHLNNCLDPLIAILLQCAVRVHTFKNTDLAPRYEKRCEDLVMLREAIRARP